MPMSISPAQAAAAAMLLRASASSRAEEIPGGSCTTLGSEASAREPGPRGCTAPFDESPRISRARNLKAPLAADIQDAEFEHASFWEENGDLLRLAWEDWDEHMQKCISSESNYSFLNPDLSSAIEDAFGDPTKETEAAVKSLWKSDDASGKPLPRGVYATELLTPSGTAAIRKLLDSATLSGIPTRRPNGMNRHGVIVDPGVDGSVSSKPLVRMIEEEIIDRVVRPVGRALFPDRIGCGDDLEYFAFTIRYGGSDVNADGKGEDDMSELMRDVDLKEHRDASVVTLNINLNLPDEGYGGSEVYFREYPSEDMDKEGPREESVPREGVRFSPGKAIIHLGAHRHGALPISASARGNEDGRRFNLVIWLFGKDGDVRIAPYARGEQMGLVERWLGCGNMTAEEWTASIFHRF